MLAPWGATLSGRPGVAALGISGQVRPTASVDVDGLADSTHIARANVAYTQPTSSCGLQMRAGAQVHVSKSAHQPPLPEATTPRLPAAVPPDSGKH